MRSWLRIMPALAGLTGLVGFGVPANAQFLEDFNTVTETGGGEFMFGSGYFETLNWDTGLTGEKAFAETDGTIQISADASGDATAGVAGSGAGVLNVAASSFNILAEDFEGAAAAGPTIVLSGDGTPDAYNLVANWDSGLVGEQAYGGAYGGAYFNGDITAEAIATGGFGGGKAGQIDVLNAVSGAGGWFAGLQWEIGGFPGAAPGLVNPGFEDGLSGWTYYNNVYHGTDFVRTGAGACLIFGPMFNDWNASLVLQDIAAEPGQELEFSAYAMTPSIDPISGGNWAVLKIEFYDENESQLAALESPPILEAGATPDVWNQYTWQATAPAGTTTARALVIFVQPPGNPPGAVWLDDMAFGPANPAPLDMSLFGLNAQVKGTVNGAGETLGEYELRIEDPNGIRLVFTETASGNWQPIGGTLDTAEERGADNMATNGAFDTNAQSFKVIVSFAGSDTWGTGGTLQVDDLALGSASLVGSDYDGGLFWDGLTLPGDALENISLTADVKGDVAGGAYALKLEAIDIVEAGLDEDFNSITTNATSVFVDQASLGENGSGYTGFENWNPELEGEAIYGGVWGTGASFQGNAEHPAHMAVSALTDAGVGGSGAAQLFVDGLVFNSQSGWYAGMTWPEQGLASTDLSQVTLTAEVKGEGSYWSGFLGPIELRMEDADGDRLVFTVTANGSWQSIGGTLDTATFAPQPEGHGNGQFDVDASTYTVVVGFGDYLGWGLGGILTVDNLYLTPVQMRVPTGSVTFEGVADGSFQSIGGLLSEGLSTLASGALDEDFEGGAGEGVDFFTGGVGGTPGGWDSGLEGEDAFGGTWGTGYLGFARAESCLSCGVSNTKGAQLITSNVAADAEGGWWAGLMWNNQPANLQDLSAAELRADIKGVPAGGGIGGEITLRVEDSAGNYLAFITTADGTYNSVGGMLNAPDRTGQRDNPIPDAVPDPNRLIPDEGAYSVIVTYVGTPTAWTMGGAVSIDNLYFAGAGLLADDYVVSVQFEDALATWGTEGTLTVDNLALVEAAGSADCDEDGDVDLVDFAGFQACFGSPATGACACADINGDSAVDLADLDLFIGQMSGPQ